MKNSKQAMLRSLIALLLCVSMFVGTTFAWFTDSVFSMNNIIQAGNLDIELEWYDPVLGWLSVNENTNVFPKDSLWEPGHTEVVYLRIKNAGSLALKYQLGVHVSSQTEGTNVKGEKFKLSDYIMMGAVNTEPSFPSREAARNAVTTSYSLTKGFATEGEMQVGAADKYVALVVYMPETVGNEANYRGEAVPTIHLGISLLATQLSAENDSFGPDYDNDAQFPVLKPGNVTVDITDKVANGALTEAVNMVNPEGNLSAVVPAGTKVTGNALTLRVSELSATGSNVTLKEDQVLRPMDVHIDGVAEDNEAPIQITVKEAMMKGLNIGNYALYHVEGEATNEMTLGNLNVHNGFTYDPATGDLTVALATFSEVAVVAEPAKWEGNFDYSWYTNAVAPVDGEAVTEYIIANADQLAAFGAIVGGMNGQTQDSFSGKTVKLISDIDLGDNESENNPDIIFYPIGYYNSEGTYERTNTAITSGLKNFEGTFDGNGHTVSNFYQNTWEMKGDHNWYSPEEQYYRDGMGLFGRVYKGTVKNLTVKNFSSDGEIATTGVIAAYADGATFENIAIFDCNPRVYNIGNGGIVGCVGWYAKEADLKTTFTNITVDNSNKISALWGSYDVACGGIVGQYYPTSGQTSAGTPKNAGIHFENCHVSAVMDVYNDVCANYQYYAYRYTGMLIGSVRENETIDGHTYPKMDGITASGCTVHFGTWNDYYYCEIIDNSTASYTHDYQMSRLTEIKAIDGTTITYLDGTTGTVPASGRANYVIVDYTKGHGTDNATCYHFKNGAVWTHDMGGIQTGVDENGDGKDDLKEDKQHIYLEFNNLVTGYGWGVTSKGVGDLAGVKILDREVADSINKFTPIISNGANFTTEKTITIGELFTEVETLDVAINVNNVQVTVSPFGAKSTAGGTYVANTTEWKNGTLTFSGVGQAVITITDYYFCKTATITVTIVGADKFDTNFVNYKDYLYRVGNANGSTVALGTIFKVINNATVDSASVKVNFETVGGNASGAYTQNTSDWTKGTIQFTGTGVVKVTISAAEAKDFVLYLEVVDATNVTGLSGTISGNVVLLNNCGLSSLTVSGRNAVYGNGFTATYTGNGQYLNNGIKFGVINISDNGVLDNLRVVATVYPNAYLYYSEAQKGLSDGNNRYFYQLSAVAATGNATISNCYIYGGRTNIYIGDGNVTVKDSVLECGTLANSQIVSSSEYTVTFEDVTTIQHQMNATIGDTKNVMFGAGILVGDGDKDNTSATAPAIVLNGTFKQYNWVTEDDKEAVSDSNAEMIIDGALNATEYNHTINGKTASNLGIIFLNDFDVKVTNKTGLPYQEGTVSLKLAGVNIGRPVFAPNGATSEQIYSDHATADRTTVNGLYQPQFKYPADLGGQYVAKTDDGDEHCYREGDTIKVMFPSGDTKELNLAGLVNIAKYSGQNLNLIISCKDANGNAVTVNNNKASLSSAGAYTISYTVTDTLFYDKNGKAYDNSIQYSWNVTIEVALKEIGIPNARFEFDSSVQKIFRSGNSNIVQFIPFLSGLKIYDYNENGEEYLRFDGGNTTSTTDYNKITSATIDNKITTGEAEGNHIVTIEFADGGKLVIDMDVRANSGSGTHSGSIKVKENVIYVVNNGTTSGKGQTWKIYSYKFVGNNGTEINSGLITFGTVGTDCDIAAKPTNNFGDTSSGDDGGGGTCLAEGTMITLADGTKKAIEDLRKGDMVMAFDHLTGKVTSNKVIIVVKTASEYYKNTFVFDDGSELVTINEHGIFDLDLNKYVNIDHLNYTEFIGHRFVSIDANGNIGTKILLDVVTVYESGYKYDIVTDQTLNYVAEDTLSVTHVLVDIINTFEFGENLMYDQAKMQADIEKYGLYAYDEWDEYCDISVYEQYNIAIMKVGVSKGLYTKEYIIGLINKYVLDESVQITD